MPNLRDLLFGYGDGEVLTPGEFTVYNTNTTSENSGSCCLWTVPSGVSNAVFEIWSAGGAGGCACCCAQGGGAGSGGYAVKYCTVSPGQQIRICAAGSTCCSSIHEGCCGECSFVCSLGGGGESTWQSKVCGGRGPSVCTRCRYYENCYSCCSQCFCCGGRSSNTDYSIAGTQGTAHATEYCFDHGFQVSANAPMTGGGTRIGPSGCCRTGGGCMRGHFPGGGGLSAQAFSGCRCQGGIGGGGMVYVVFY